MTGYLQLLPEALVLLAALAALFADRLPGRDRTAAYAAAGCAGAAAVLVAWGGAPGGAGGALFGGMLVADGPARLVRTAVPALAGLWALWLAGREVGGGERSREAISLALFSAAGGMLLAMSRDLITLYMALELSTMPAYVMVGYRRDDIRGLEGALKYFLMSMLTSLVMMYGLSFVYGISGTTMIADISLDGAGSLGLVAALLTLTGLFAKLSAAPFHFWAPDAYAGASPASVAFVSTVPKIAGAIVTVRLVAALAPGVPQLAGVLAAVAVASMLLGNLAALTQTDMRRLIAYSGVAHSGYLLMGVSAAALAAGGSASVGSAAVLGSLGAAAAVFYAVAYSVPSLAVMLPVAEEGDGSLDSLAGLATRRPAVAWAMVVWLVSLIGIPPLAGFFGKLTLFSAAIQTDLTWLAVIAVATSVLSAAYYFRIIHAMFLAERPEAAPESGSVAAGAPSRSAASSAAIAIAVVATFALGIGASSALRWLGI